MAVKSGRASGQAAEQLVKSTVSRCPGLVVAEPKHRHRGWKGLELGQSHPQAGWGGPSSVGDPCLVLRTPEAQREVPHQLRGVASHSLDQGHPVEVAPAGQGEFRLLLA